MNRLTTAQRTVGLVQCCRSLILSFLLLVILGGIGKLNITATGFDRGYLTNSQELTYIRQQSQQGIQPFAALVTNFMSGIDSPTGWSYGTGGRDYLGAGGVCVSTPSDSSGIFLSQRGGAQGVYEKMIAYYLTGNLDYAIVARQKILELTGSYGFGGNLYSGGNQCILELGFAIPIWIQAADLLETSSIWSVADKRQFQTWLATTVYPKVAWASNVRRNNWGAAGSLSASMIADYLWDYNIVLNEVKPTARLLRPAQAGLYANANQLQRMNTLWKGDSQCNIYGIRSYGGIPDELRRGTSACDSQWLLTNDASFTYQILQIEILVFHAEYLSRRGNLSIYNNLASDGSGNLLKAISFVIANPTNPSHSFDWTSSKRGVLFVANTHYHNPAISSELSDSTTVRRGSMVAFAELTHALDIGATPPQATPSPVPSASATVTVRPTNTALPTLTSTLLPTLTSTPLPTLTAIPTQTLSPINTAIVGTTLVLNPVADAYVTSDTPNSNFAGATSLRTDSSPIVRSYLRFTVPPTSGTVLSATLRVYTKSSLPLGFNLHSTTGAWQENTINFNNAPTFGSVLAISRPTTGNQWAEATLTSLITGAGGNYSFVMTSSSTTSTAFASRESSSNKPQLVLVLSGAVTTSSMPLLEAAPISASATTLPMNTSILVPTDLPSTSATVIPTDLPTDTATLVLTDLPMDTATLILTALPTNTATLIPTVLPTDTATAVPTVLPTDTATAVPTDLPIPSATVAATQNP